MTEETKRHYGVSEDPIVEKEIGEESAKDIRLAVYEQSVLFGKNHAYPDVAQIFV